MKPRKLRFQAGFLATILLFAASVAHPQSRPVAVGPQYDSTHVYLAPADFDAFVKSFLATFGGTSANRSVVNVLPVPSREQFQFLVTPVGTLSVFAYLTPVPYPFGEERTGYMVADMDQALKAVRGAGGEVIVEPFPDAIGIDAVIQWPGGVKMQLYRHSKQAASAPLETVPDNRVYVSKDAADNFVRAFLQFSGGKVTSDVREADAGEIARPEQRYRRIRITSLFGSMQVSVTDGYLPYPFGREITGYQVKNLDEVLEKAKAAGAKVLFSYDGSDRKSAMVQFPGGYIAEIHSLASAYPSTPKN